MKKLKKNQLKLDKEVITSLSENDLFSVRGGVNINETLFPVCIIRPSVDPKECETRGEKCLVTHNDKCIAVSKDNDPCVGPAISGVKNSCVCLVPITQFNC